MKGERRLAGIWSATVDRPVATLMIAIGIAVFGALSFKQLPLALMPELSYPTLTVRTEYEGAAPEEVEAELTKPLEEYLRTVEGLRAISSTSRAGLSDVVLEFQWDTDMDYVSQRVRERIDVITFPRAAERPLVLRYDPALDPIMRIGVVGTGEATSGRVRLFAQEEIARALEKIKGVAIVRVYGGQEELVRVDLDQRRMAQLGVTVEQVQQRLQAENVNLAGGQIDEGGVRYLVRTLNEFQDLEELRRMSVGLRQGEVLRLNQIGRVYLDHRDREVITRIDGQESVEIEIYKEADANIVSVAQQVRDKLFGSEAQRAWVKAQQRDPERRGARPEGEEDLDEEGDDGARQDRAESQKRQERAAQAKRRREAVARQMTDYISHDLPSEIRVELLSDQSSFIRNAVGEVVNTALLGGLCAILVLYVFLRSSLHTLIISAAIPLSVVTTFALMRMVSINLNIMSLGGLALGIGMLVDNSIVVLESIHRCLEEGDPPRSGAIRGAREVGGAVIASTLTTIAVFFPIIFVEGVAGQLFGDLALTVVFSLLASLVVALFVVPMLSAWRPFKSPAGSSDAGPQAQPDGHLAALNWRRWLNLSSWALTRDDLTGRWTIWRSRPMGRRILWAPLESLWAVYVVARGLALGLLELLFARLAAGLFLMTAWLLRTALTTLGWLLVRLAWPLLWGFDRGFKALERTYPVVLRGALGQKTLVLMVAAGLLGLSAWILRDIGMELIPALHQGTFRAELRMPIGTALEDTAAATKDVEADFRELQGVAKLSSFIGDEKTSTSEGDRGEHSATVHVTLEPTRDIEAQERRVMRAARKLLAEHPGLQSELLRPTLFTLQTPIQVEIRGYDLRLLKLYSDQVVQALSEMPELTDIRASQRAGYPEARVEFDRDRLALYGMTVRQAADVVQSKVRGDAATDLRREERRVDVLVRARRADVATVSDLENLIVGQRALGAEVQVAAGEATSAPVLLGAVAKIRVEEGPSEIRHLDGQRAALIEANVTGVSLATAIERVQARLATLKLPQGMSARVGGQREEIERARSALLLALLLAVFLVYVIMASQFESLLAPMVIIFTVPLAAVGVAGALWVTRTPLSVVVFIGLIMLTGIVVNNAIVLIDYAIQLHQRGARRREALIQACSMRLRPVLITTATTVLGLLPMALGLGEGTEIRSPLAITVIAGLLSSTALTLLVIPVVYDLLGAARRAPHGEVDDTDTLSVD